MKKPTPKNISSLFKKKSNRKFTNLATKFLTVMFYLIIGLIASVALFLFYDFLLSRTSSITTFYLNTKYTPFYMWYYTVSTILAILLFGVDVALTVYLLRRTNRIISKEQGGSITGVIIGAFAASCPVCSGVLLALVGITGGLAAFPFKGLELKTLSAIFLALPLFFLIRRVKNPNCDDNCPVPKNASFQKKDIMLVVSLLLFFFAELLLAYSLLKTEPVLANILTYQQNLYISATDAKHNAQVAKNIQDEVLPAKGFQTPIVLGSVILEMVSKGVIDMQKFEDTYKTRGGIPKEVRDLLTKPSTKPLVINAQNQFFLVTLLWPLGLANKMNINNQSPVAGKDVNNYASTGGWTLGKEQNGGAYFNKYSFIILTKLQEQRVKYIAENTFRPCCNNSTFFQDCNHGSAALALIELGVSQGLTDDQIYQTLLEFNSFWFPQNYIETALYFQAVKQTNWSDVNAQLVLSKDYSSIGGWISNVDPAVQKFPGLLPKPTNGGSCGA